MKRLFLTVAALVLFVSAAPAATYVLNADGTVVKQEDAPKAADCPKSCDCGCKSGEQCLCTAGKADTSAELPFVQATADYVQVCGPTGCQLVPVNATAPAMSTMSVGEMSTYTYADAGTSADVVEIGGGRRGRRVLRVIFPRLAAVHQARVANGTALVAPACPPQSFGTPLQTTFPMPAGPLAAPVQAPQTAAAKAMALQRGQWMQLVFKYGFAVVQLMPELIPLVTTHGWQVLTNPAVDAWIIQAIFAINHGQPIPPVPTL